jgi:hypothetical protein
MGSFSLSYSLESAVLRTVSNLHDGFSISHSSISERLNVISVDFFEKIFKYALSSYKGTATALHKDIVRFDTTIVAISTKLINTGYNIKGGDSKNYRLLKFTVGYSDMPDCICFYKDPTYNSENKALMETILANQQSSHQINVFDRGINARDNYDKLTEKGISFISRLSPGSKQQLHIANKVTKGIETATVKIISDSWVYLYAQGGRKSNYPVRIIEAEKNDDEEKIIFITNIRDIESTEVIAIYKSRWDI